MSKKNVSSKEAETKALQNPTKVALPMAKEDLQQEVKTQVDLLRSYAEDLSKLCSTLQAVVNGGDVSFIALDDSKTCLEGISETRGALEKTRRALKARASARMRES